MPRPIPFLFSPLVGGVLLLTAAEMQHASALGNMDHSGSGKTSAGVSMDESSTRYPSIGSAPCLQHTVSLNNEQSTSTTFSDTAQSELLLKSLAIEKCEENITGSLQKSYLSEFTRKVRQAGLIPKYIKDDLDHVHIGTDHETKCRYLIMNVCKVVQVDEYAFSKFLKTCSSVTVSKIEDCYRQLRGTCESSEGLSSHGSVVGLNIDEHYRGLCTLLHQHASMWLEIGIALKISHNWLSNINSNFKTVERCLNRLLLEWLSGQYEDAEPCTLQNLCLALSSNIVGRSADVDQVQKYLLDSCRSHVNNESGGTAGKCVGMPIVLHQSCDVTLADADLDTKILLEVLLQCDESDHVSFQWYKDGEVLESPLSYRYLELDRMGILCVKERKSRTVCSCTLGQTAIASHPITTRVRTLLENNEFPESPLSYRTIALHNKGMLCLKVRDISDEGTYKCSYNFKDVKLESSPITVKIETSVDKYKADLTKWYLREYEIVMDDQTWPPVSQNTYINLAVINEEGPVMSDEHYQQTIQGDSDDLFCKKASVDYHMAFSNISHGDRVLVKGRPGSGKTTLVHKISQDWAKNILCFGNIRILFLIYLRCFRSNHLIGLRDLVQCYFSSPKEVDRICDYAEKHHGSGMCFILDGLDEYQHHYEDAYINKLIKGGVLRQAVVIVASRPAALAKFKRCAKKHIEVLGFFKEQIEMYIDTYKFCSTKFSSVKSLNLKKYLAHHPNIHHMCYLPIQAAMICFLYDKTDGNLPNTETQIYKEIVKHAVLRARYREVLPNKTLKTLDDLQETEARTLLKVCKLAFEKTKISNQVLEHEELLDKNGILDSFGLITHDLMVTTCGSENMYSFCHLTFQEFLAAYYISQLELQKQYDIIQTCGPMKHMSVVFKFYCGLVTFDAQCSRLIKLFDVSCFNRVHKLHCCFESQQPSTCDYVPERGCFIVDEDFNTPSDYTCLGYMVVNAVHNPVKVLGFDHFYLDEDCVDAFTKETSGKDVPIKLLRLSSSQCRRKALNPPYWFGWSNEWKPYRWNDLPMHVIHNFMRACPALLVLDLYYIDCIPFSRISHDVKREPCISNVEIVCINPDRSSSFCQFDFTECIETLKYKFPKLRKIFLPRGITYSLPKLVNNPYQLYSVRDKSLSSFINDDFEEAEVIVISDDLKHAYSCISLSLINCKIDNKKAILLAEGLSCNSTLECLKLTLNCIGDEGASAIAKGLVFCTSLNTLDMSLNRIGYEGAQALVDSVKNKIHFKLYLFGSRISDSYKRDHFIHNGDNILLMETLSINDSIGDAGLRCIDSQVEECTHGSIENSLNTLKLRSCNASSEGIKGIANILTKFSFSLQSISLVDMNIYDDCIKLLASALECCHSLHILNLSRNSIGQEGAQTIAQMIQQCKEISELNLSANDIAVSGVHVLCEALKSINNLQSINLGYNNIGNEGALSVASVLQEHCTSLHTIDLSHTGISGEGAVSIGNSLKNCTCLKELYFNFNIIESCGVDAINNALKNCPHLCRLSMIGNDIKDYGAETLASSIQTLHQLTLLDLSDNNICWSGAVSLGKGLKNCKYLHTLRLNDNHFYCGVEDIAEGVKDCQKLFTLELRNTCIDAEDVHSIAAILKDCSNLRQLDLSNNHIDTFEIYSEDYPQKCDIFIHYEDNKYVTYQDILKEREEC